MFQIVKDVCYKSHLKKDMKIVINFIVYGDPLAKEVGVVQDLRLCNIRPQIYI